MSYITLINNESVKNRTRTLDIQESLRYRLNHSFQEYWNFTFLVPINVLCQGSQGDFRQHVPRPIDGAVVVSKNERDKDCTVTFQTESILENFMIRFSHLNIDCNDKLMIYDGAHTYGNLVVSFFLYHGNFFLSI